MIGKKLADRYEITAELGRGGMGVVYRAHDPRLDREVAIKLIPPTQLNADAEQRFQREAQVVAQMDHPAIVPVYDFGRHEGSLFFVMPVVQGSTSRSCLRGQSLSLGDILDLTIQVAEALEYSHSRAVVHRDIKPENIMVTRDDAGGVRVRVMDFGLARASTETRLTKTGTLVGTLAYLSPEQVSARSVDARSDIYSLGTVLYECVTGEPPFSGEVQSILYRIVHEIPQPPRSIGAGIDEELEAIILSCLAKDPGSRPQTAAELAERLKRYRATLRDSERAKTVVGLTRTIQTGRPSLAPFVGRGEEFLELQQRLNAAVAGECQFAVVSGEPGIGKTRLVDELENLARARKIRVLHGRSVEQDRSFPYQGFCEIIQEFFRLKETGVTSLPDFSDIGADLVTLFPMLSEINDIRAAAGGSSSLAQAGGSAGPENRSQIFELLSRTLTRIAGGKPLVLVLEDLHDAEVTIEALQYIVRRLGPTATLIIGTYRSTEIETRHPLTRLLESFRGDRRFAAIRLQPFALPDHRKFVETLVGGPRLADNLVQRLFEATEGNPFFTKELVRSLLDSGGIARDDSGAWSLSTEVGLSSDALPATIQQAVAKRIERLPDELRDTLAVAAVIGRSFDFKDLEKLGDGSDLEDSIDRLMREGYLEEEPETRGDILNFSSGVVRDVLYGSLSRRKRRSLHRKFAELIEKRHAGRLERILPQLVHHFYQGDIPDKTVEYGLRLARASLDAFSAEEAARSARAALEFLDDEWEGDRSLEGEARTLLAQALRMSGDIEASLREADTAVAIFERQSAPGRAVTALLLAAETAWQARRSDEATRRAEKGLELARQAGETEGLHQLLSLGATLANLRGDYARASRYLDEAARLGVESRGAQKEQEIPQGGTLVVALANPVKPISPAVIEANEEAEVAANIFETLLATDAQGTLIPSLCEKWEAMGAGRAFRLTLRKEIRFSDGTPLTAREVKAAFERTIRTALPEVPAALAAIRGSAEHRAGSADGVEGIVVHGDDQLEIRLAEPLPIYPAMLTEASTGVARPAGETAEPKDAFVGTGPFRVASQRRETIVLQRNELYWRPGVPRLDTLEFRPALSTREIVAGYRSGDLDVARDLLPQDLEELLRDQRFRQGLVETPKRNTYFILFNVLTGPSGANPEVRRALAGSLRVRDLVWETLGRFAQPAACLIPPGMLGHDPGRRGTTLARKDALQVLAASGAPTPLKLKASVHPLLTDRYGTLLKGLFTAWKELGVEVSVETPDMASYLESWPNNKGIDLVIGRWNADYDDPDNFTHALFHSSTGALRLYFSSVEIDRALEEGRSEGRPAVREALYRKIDHALTEQNAVIPLFHDIDYRLTSRKVRALKLRGTTPYVNYPEIGLAEPAEPEPEVQLTGGGIIQVPIAGAIVTLDPARCETYEQNEILPSIFETLTRDMGDANIVPWLAAEIKAEDNGRRYRFRLRDGIRFHDGRKLSARDVRYSFERLLQTPDTEVPHLYAPIRGSRAILEGKAGDLAGFRIHSAGEFSVELEEPVAFFLALLSYPAAAIVPEGSDPTDGVEAGSIVGTGPFRFVSFQDNRRLELERHRSYWRRGFPKSEGLVFSFKVTPEETLSGLKSGRFSIATDLFPADVEGLLRKPEFAAKYQETPRLSTYYLALANHHGPLQDHELRRRILNAFDTDRLVRQTLGRLATPAASLIPPGLLGHDPSQKVRTDSAPSVAPARLARPIELNAAVNPIFFGGYAAIYKELSKNLAEAGFKIRNVTQSMEEFLETSSHGTVDVVVGRWAADYPDADSFGYVLHSQAGYLGRLCGTPEIDRLVERARTEPSSTARHSLYRQFEEALSRQATIVPLFHEQAYRFVGPEIKGLKISFGTPIVFYEELHR